MKKLMIWHDTSPMHPRKDQDNLGSMVCWHRRYQLGDIQPRESPREWRDRNLPAGSIELPLFLFDHSGLTLRTDASGFRAADQEAWDWGQLGFIFCPLDKILKEYGNTEPATLQKVREMLELEVQVYDQYLRGSVWCYEYGDDSCGGFFGDTLEETGILYCLPESAQSLAKEAWESRLGEP